MLDAEFPGRLDVVYEGVGGDLFRAALANLSPTGRLLSVGYISVRSQLAKPKSRLKLKQLICDNRQPAEYFWSWVGRVSVAVNKFTTLALVELFRRGWPSCRPASACCQWAIPPCATGRHTGA